MYSPFIRFLFFGWWGGIAAPLQCLLLSDSDVAHHGCLLSRNLFENSGKLLFELVEVDDGSAKAVSDPILHIAGNTVEEQGDARQLVIVTGLGAEGCANCVDVACTMSGADTEDGLLAILAALQDELLGTILLMVLMSSSFIAEVTTTASPAITIFAMCMYSLISNVPLLVRLTTIRPHHEEVGAIVDIKPLKQLPQWLWFYLAPLPWC